MKRIALLLVLFSLTGCSLSTSPSGPDSTEVVKNVYRYHDQENGVTCYIFDGYKAGGIDCLPDSELKR